MKAADLDLLSCRKVLEDTKLMHKQKKRRAVPFASCSQIMAISACSRLGIW